MKGKPTFSVFVGCWASKKPQNSFSHSVFRIFHYFNESKLFFSCHMTQFANTSFPYYCWVKWDYPHISSWIQITKSKEMSESDSRCCIFSFSMCCLPPWLDSVSSPYLLWLWSRGWPPQSSLSCQHCRPIYPAPIHQPVNEVAGLLGCGKTIHPPTLQSQHAETASSLLAGLCWQS